MSKLPLLSVNDLTVRLYMENYSADPVEGLDFHINHGETLGLVGESGCGKSLTALSIMGLLPEKRGRMLNGKIIFNGKFIHNMPKDKLRRIRGRDLAMIFQEPMTSLNPVLTIGRQLAEPLMAHNNMSYAHAMEEAGKWLEYVKISPRRLSQYPHMLSGGLRQRVMIAGALICRPKLLIADEPTTALDVTIQAEILSILMRLKTDFNMSLLLITHDLGVVAQTADRVVVMYAGRVVEEAGVFDLFERPFHPYTQGLLNSLPASGAGSGEGFIEIKGNVPPLGIKITGCRFHERCSHAFSLCREKEPALYEMENGRKARCFLFEHPHRRKAP